MLTRAQREFFDQNGYVVVPTLFNGQEVEFYLDYYTELRNHEQCRRDTNVANGTSGDPLLQYPRLMQMHRWDDTTLNWLLDARINQCMVDLLDREPLAVQTMFYFKPPHARGQALHQDNYYLRVQPGTCIAAWMALDACEIDNGCLQVVPGSHTWPTLCTTQADTTQSFTDVTVPIPDGYAPVPVLMQPGDVLFFNGSLVHGSFPNQTNDRFRRSLIGHYIEGDSQKVAQWYFPVLRMDGTPIEIDQSEQGSQCGVWVTEDGQPVIEMARYETPGKKTE